MFLELSYQGCHVYKLIIGQNYFVLGGGTFLKVGANLNVYSTRVPFDLKKTLFPLLC